MIMLYPNPCYNEVCYKVGWQWGLLISEIMALKFNDLGILAVKFNC